MNIDFHRMALKNEKLILYTYTLSFFLFPLCIKFSLFFVFTPSSCQMKLTDVTGYIPKAKYILTVIDVIF